MYVGKPLLRDEDYRFLRGDGQYTADIEMPNAAWASFVRSPHGHARINHISKDVAASMPGVLAVLTAEDWEALGYGFPICRFVVDSSDGTAMNSASRPVFASGSVRHVGDTVAAVIAETREQALDAAEVVEVDYEPLPAVTNPARALDGDAPIIHERFGTNLAQRVEHVQVRVSRCGRRCRIHTCIGSGSRVMYSAFRCIGYE
jgi:carbon-monoxide dehydrogenase large subunit